MLPFDRLISEKVAPVLKVRGFVRSRRFFYKAGSPNDIAEVCLEPSRFGSASDISVVAGHSLYVREYHDDRGWDWPKRLSGVLPGGPLWMGHIRNPRVRGFGSEVWDLDFDNDEGIALFLEALTAAADEVMGLANRPTLVAWLKALDPDGADPCLRGMPNSQALRIIKAN